MPFVILFFPEASPMVPPSVRTQLKVCNGSTRSFSTYSPLELKTMENSKISCNNTIVIQDDWRNSDPKMGLLVFYFRFRLY